MSDPTKLARYLSLEGKNVFITGGGTGIGAAIVTAFVEQGAHVAFVDVAEAESRALASQLASGSKAKIWWRTCDVRDVAALQAATNDAARELGDFSVLVNNVARDDRHTLESVTPEYWDAVMAVNVRGVYLGCNLFSPAMVARGSGHIVNITSMGGFITLLFVLEHVVFGSQAHRPVVLFDALPDHTVATPDSKDA